MDRPSHLGLRHVALNVQDVARVSAFYVEMLGFTVEWAPDGDNVYLTSGSDNLALHRAGDIEPRGSGALDHLGLAVRAADDVDAWAAFLESQGVTIVRSPETHRDGARSCYISDPEGNRVQLIYHPPISRHV